MRSKEDYRKAVEHSTSLTDMCKYFDILPMGGNFDTMKHAIARYDLDTSHFANKVVLHDNHGKKFNRNKINKQILIDLYGYTCSNPECKLSEWNGERLVLQVDHIDGNNTNDAIENLRLLCPNCHSQTETFCMSSNIDNTRTNLCECGNSKQRTSSFCGSCIKINNDVKRTIKVPKKYKKEDLEDIVQNSISYAEVIRKLGNNSSKTATIANAIHYYQIDTSHFVGQAWNKGKNLKDNPKNKLTWKKKLLLERGHKCENCKRTHWINNTSIPLELEHIDGNNKNNVEDNLKLLCSNCHSQTKTWKRKKATLEKETHKKSRTYKYGTCKCGATKLVKSPQCEKCHKATLERIAWPSTDELVAMVEESSFVAVARVLGVSDNAVRKRIKNHPV